MKIAILALQGAFAEHEQMFRNLGAETTLIRNLADWRNFMSSPSGGMRGGTIPGGESTAMMRIMRDEGLFEPIRRAILDGLPAFGTCAGLIMLDRNHLNVMDIKARRNAYGRQLGSFNTEGDFVGIGQVPMTFIRAPYIEEAGPEVEILARVDGKAVAARQKNMLVTAFHPELTDDTSVHELFLGMVTKCHVPV
ncbi:MAG: pyridoxal 5'-phosphate synthase glutaminase subunit PdxT [Bacteroidaceae bacterium]|nr:pyridoxal 5'-phosphate synthase glutaminase subunit PdxT [Bacteroidaceae bacterium]MBQ9294927.1 pyridoxal 5'-phosphate synthase glutaminase subunit PdxT [Bacteroidaceae bacterium]